MSEDLDENMAGQDNPAVRRVDLLRLATPVEFGEVNALSIRQPYPHFIFHGGDGLPQKQVENRNWPTKYRGWFLIHASASRQEGRETIKAFNLPLGGIVGIARIADCVTERSGDPWFYGPYGFVLADAMPLPLVPARGQLGFFCPASDVAEQVAAHIRHIALKMDEGGML